jgi:hypothetical protein
MRTTLLAASLLLGLIGCTRGADPAPAPPAHVAVVPATPAALHLAPAPSTLCPRAWICEATAWPYPSRTQCIAACPTGCANDYVCGGRCVCP